MKKPSFIFIKESRYIRRYLFKSYSVMTRLPSIIIPIKEHFNGVFYALFI